MSPLDQLINAFDLKLTAMAGRVNLNSFHGGIYQVKLNGRQ